MGMSPQTVNANDENFGPVEMDSILPMEAQPPILQTYNQPWNNQEFLTDRFGFIYDQRRKKRQKEAADKMKSSKRSSRIEMLHGARGVDSDMESLHDSRPNTPQTSDETVEDGKTPRRWQDYLKAATFPTELLSHTPSGGEGAFAVLEGRDAVPPKSPGLDAGGRGFVPSQTPAPLSPPSPSILILLPCRIMI